MNKEKIKQILEEWNVCSCDNSALADRLLEEFSPDREIENFLKWCKGRFGLDDETGEMYESEYGETWSFKSVLAEYRDEIKQSLGESEGTE